MVDELGTDRDGNPLVWRSVVLPDGVEGGLACTRQRSAELSDDDIVAMVQAQFPPES